MNSVIDMTVIEKFIKLHTLSKSEYLELLRCWKDEKTVARLKEEAVNLRKQHYGNKVFTRGLIEFTNFCKNNFLSDIIFSFNSHK